MSTYLWQNFLKDSKYIRWAVEKIFDLLKKHNLNKVVEIWPGKGAITKHLASKTNLILFEKDKSFLPAYQEWWNLAPVDKIWKFEVWQSIDLPSDPQALAGDVKGLPQEAILPNISTPSKFVPNISSTDSLPSIKLFLWDFLDATPDLENFDQALFFGNLPYYITSPILTKIATEFGPKAGLFMVQKEVWEKVDSQTNKKSYLRWILNYFYDVRCAKKVPAKAFSPPPKVDSCWIELIKKSDQPKLPLSWLQKFLDLIKAKRQTIKKNLARHGIKLDLELWTKRLEELGWEDMEILYNHLKDEI